ncbi:MAG TPA: hypothetical protein VMS18_02585 [Candidatus Binatia bacterium]|nr:hypothetical protein [Candidatus Binatia bacterium]
MQVLKLFLSPQVDVPDDVLQAAGKQLKRYFDLICVNQRPRKFLNSMFKVAPHAGEVSDVDLVAYITQGSLIISLMDKVYEPGVDHSNLLHGHAGGGTTKMPDGRVLSEVYWTGGLMALKTSTSDRRGITLANLIFHEWAHNKHTSDPQALGNGEGRNGSHVHFFYGGGPLQMGLSYGALAGISNINANLAAMARVLDAQNKQSICGLYNDDLGY